MSRDQGDAVPRKLTCDPLQMLALRADSKPRHKTERPHDANLIEDCESSEFQVRNESRKLLLAYAYGKPTEKHEHGGENGAPITLKVVYESKSQ